MNRKLVDKITIFIRFTIGLILTVAYVFKYEIYNIFSSVYHVILLKCHVVSCSQTYHKILLIIIREACAYVSVCRIHQLYLC